MTSFTKLVLAMVSAVIFMMATSNIARINAIQTKGKIDREINQITQEQIVQLDKARNVFYKIYKRYPNNIDEIVDAGLIRSTFKTSKFSKDITIDPITKKITLAIDQDRIQRNISLVATSHILQTKANKDLISIDSAVKTDINIRDLLNNKKDLSSLELNVTDNSVFDNAVRDLNLTNEGNSTDLYDGLNADQIKTLNKTLGY